MNDDIFQYPEKLKKSIGDMVRENPNISFEIVFAGFSYIPGVHRYNKYLYETYRTVVQEITGLCKDIVENKQAWAALQDIETIIETDKIERGISLQEAKARREVIQKEQRVKGKRLDVEEAQLDAKLKDLKSPIPEEPAKTKEERRQEEIQRIREDAEHRTDKEFVKQESNLEKKLRIGREKEEKLRECDEQYKKDYRVKDIADLDDEATKKWKADRRTINNHFDRMGLSS